MATPVAVARTGEQPPFQDRVRKRFSDPLLLEGVRAAK
jgi:hypothetical protein